MISLEAKQLFEQICSKKKLLLIDVRQPEEFNFGVIAGAHLFPMTDIPGRLSELEGLINDNQDHDVVVYCRSGGRSEQVITFLERRGCRELANLVGGTQDYSEFDASVQRY